MIKFLLRLWAKFPMWTHIVAARLVRPKFLTAVSVLVFDERECILLFNHTYRKLAWGIPAGGLEFGEQPQDAIVREFFEESGMTLEVQRLLLAESARAYRHVTLVYLGRVVDGAFRASHEISAMGYFDVSNLPPMLFDEKNLIRKVHAELFGQPVSA